MYAGVGTRRRRNRRCAARRPRGTALVPLRRLRRGGRRRTSGCRGAGDHGEGGAHHAIADGSMSRMCVCNISMHFISTHLRPSHFMSNSFCCLADSQDGHDALQSMKVNLRRTTAQQTHPTTLHSHNTLCGGCDLIRLALCDCSSCQ